MPVTITGSLMGALRFAHPTLKSVLFPARVEDCLHQVQRIILNLRIF